MLYGKIGIDGKICNLSNHMLTPEEKIQYHRHLILDKVGTEGQEKLKEAKVLVVGAGGLSCAILQYIVAAGVGTVGIIDHDVIDQSNLQRQILYTVSDIGKPKVDIAAKRLSKLNPWITINVYSEKLTQNNALELFSKYDIIVDGSDNFPTRYLVNDACVLQKKPLVFGSISQFEGQVTVFNYKDGPTYRCLFPTPPNPEEVPNCSDIGVLGVLPGIIGNLQAMEVLKIILNIGAVLRGKLLLYNALNCHQSLLSFKKDNSIQIKELEQDYPLFCGIKEKSFKEISAKNLKLNIGNYTLLDVRTLSETKTFSVDGIHIPLSELSKRSYEIPNTKPVVVCCQSGIRSRKAISIISDERNELELINLKDGLATFF